MYYSKQLAMTINNLQILVELRYYNESEVLLS